MTDKPLPGTPDAISQGCTCQPWDGEPRVIETYPMWLVDGCPIHDPREAEEPDE